MEHSFLPPLKPDFLTVFQILNVISMIAFRASSSSCDGQISSGENAGRGPTLEITSATYRDDPSSHYGGKLDGVSPILAQENPRRIEIPRSAAAAARDAK